MPYHWGAWPGLVLADNIYDHPEYLRVAIVAAVTIIVSAGLLMLATRIVGAPRPSILKAMGIMAIVIVAQGAIVLVMALMPGRVIAMSPPVCLIAAALILMRMLPTTLGRAVLVVVVQTVVVMAIWLVLLMVVMGLASMPHR